MIKKYCRAFWMDAIKHWFQLVPVKEDCGSGIFVRRNGATVEISREEWDKLNPGQEPVTCKVGCGGAEMNLKCDVCGHSVKVVDDGSDQWDGSACDSVGCPGHYQFVVENACTCGEIIPRDCPEHGKLIGETINEVVKKPRKCVKCGGPEYPHCPTCYPDNPAPKCDPLATYSPDDRHAACRANERRLMAELAEANKRAELAENKAKASRNVGADWLKAYEKLQDELDRAKTRLKAATSRLTKMRTT